MKVFVAGATGAMGKQLVPRLVARAQPDVIVHQLTAIPGALDIRHFDRGFALTNRLRTDGKDHLLSAGRAVWGQAFVQELA